MEVLELGGGGLNFDPNFFYYPALTFYLQFIIQSVHYLIGHLLGAYPTVEAFRQAYTSDPTTFIILARATTILFDAGSMAVLFLIGRAFANVRVGILAAALCAVNLLHVKQSHLINVDTPLTFFCILTVYFAYKVYSERSQCWYLLAGLSIGLAASTKYNGAVLAVVLLAAHLLQQASFSEAIRSIFDRRLIKAALIMMGVFVLLNPYVFLNAEGFWRDFGSVQQHMEYGHLGIDHNTSTAAYYLLESIPSNLSWPLWIFCILAAAYLISRREKRYWVLLIFPIAYIMTIGSMVARAERYIFPIFPSLILIAAVGCVLMFDSIFERRKGISALLRGKIFVNGAKFAMLGLLFLPMSISTLHYHRLHALPDTRAVAKQWIINNVKPGAAIASGPFGLAFEPGMYDLVTIPFNAGQTELTTPFYDARWYEDLDIVVTSDYDYGRYKQEPERFKRILSFYDSLRAKWSLVSEIVPEEGQNGWSFWLYRPPGTITPDVFSEDLFDHLLEEADSNRILRFTDALSRALFEKGKFNKSVQLAAVSLQTAPDRVQILNRLLTSLFKAKRYDEAIAVSERSLQLYPKQIDVLLLQCNIYVAVNETGRAAECLERVLGLDNRSEMAYRRLMLIYGVQKDHRKVLDLLQRYLAILPPGSDKARLIEAQIKQLVAG